MSDSSSTTTPVKRDQKRQKIQPPPVTFALDVANEHEPPGGGAVEGGVAALARAEGEDDEDDLDKDEDEDEVEEDDDDDLPTCDRGSQNDKILPAVIDDQLPSVPRLTKCKVRMRKSRLLLVTTLLRNALILG
jgi:hypothetical protein